MVIWAIVQIFEKDWRPLTEESCIQIERSLEKMRSTDVRRLKSSLKDLEEYGIDSLIFLLSFKFTTQPNLFSKNLGWFQGQSGWIAANFFDALIGQINLCLVLFWILSKKMPLEVILKPAIQTGVPSEIDLRLEKTLGLLGFLEMTGWALSSLIIKERILVESKAESAMTALMLRLKSETIFLSWWIIKIESWELAGEVSSAMGSSETASIRIWFLYPQKNSIFFELFGKVTIIPSFASLSPFGMQVLVKRFLTLVLRLFSLTLALMGQESAAIKLPDICLSWISREIKDFLTFWKILFGVFLTKAENLSFEGKFRKPQSWAISGLLRRCRDKSAKVGIENRFLQRSSTVSLCRWEH